MVNKMEKANLPTEKAFEHAEGAHQPLVKQSKIKHTITFAATTADNEKSDSLQTPLSSSYNEVLSQPAPVLTHRQKMLWIQNRRRPGLWVQCDDCDKWRFMPNTLERHELPNKWYCRMNSDTSMANCSVPESPLNVREGEDLIYNEYTAGSVVWARLKGWPWWPAMVDDCPDVEQFYWIDGFSDILVPTHYHVAFFDASNVKRAWVSRENLMPYDSTKKLNNSKIKKYRKRLEVSIQQANDAETLTLANRLAKNSFIARYKGNIVTPRKVNRTELNKYQNYLKRKFNIEFPFETSSDSEGDDANAPTNKHNKRKNATKLSNKTNAINNDILKKVGGTDKNVNEKIISTRNATNDELANERCEQQPCSNYSMLAQIGSSVSEFTNDFTNNDSSKTDLPESNTQSKDNTQSEFQNLKNGTGSPNSLNFNNFNSI